MTDNSSRFSDRVADYVRTRPSYPQAAIDYLVERCDIGAGRVVADIGAGTGILTRELLATGAAVVAVEPNAAMRDAMVQQLGPTMRVLDGTAEATGIDEGTIDVITAAQAFHWFDPVATRHEFERVLRPGGTVALLWNERLTDTTDFLREYEQLLLVHGTDYDQVNHRNIGVERVHAFFAPNDVDLFEVEHVQQFDWNGFLGRVLSSSYVPAVGQPGNEQLVDAVRALYDMHEVDGIVEWQYRCSVFVGQLAGPGATT